MRFLYFTSLLIILVSIKGFAQDDTETVDPVLIKLRGRILNIKDSSVVQYANILNMRTHSGTISNTQGNFSMEMLNIDSLIVTSIGYLKTVIKVPANYSGYTVLDYYITPINYGIGEVKVQAEGPKPNLGIESGRPTDIDPALRGDAFNQAPPLAAAFFNPISYWQYYLSKKEKRKREVRKEMAVQKNWDLHSQNYNKEKVMMLTGMNEMQADSFMIWFNGQDVLPYLASEYQIRASIIEYFHYYQIEKSASHQQSLTPAPSPGEGEKRK